MKEYFPILSRYNETANRAMYAVLSGLPVERLTEEVGSYFKSVMGLLNHLYGSDLIWLQRVRDLLPKLASLESSELDVAASWPTTDLVKDFGELRAKRESLDALLRRLTDELSDEDLAAVLDYTNSRGERVRFLLWQALMHVFNHASHHRGQIAEILDEMGVANNYSDLIATLVQPPPGSDEPRG